MNSGITTADRARIALLGLNAWVVVVLVPTLHVGVDSLMQLALLVSPLPALALGMASLAPARVRLARILLLALVPPLIGLAVAARPALVLREIFDPITLTLAALSLLAYAAAAARACSRPTRTMPVHSHPARARAAVPRADDARPRRRPLRRLLIGTVTALGLAMVLIVPAWMTRAARVARWGEAADDSVVFTAVLAAAVGAFSIGAVVGPGLRRRKQAISAKRRRRHLTLAAVAAVVAFAGWLALHYLDH